MSSPRIITRLVALLALTVGLLATDCAPALAIAANGSFIQYGTGIYRVVGGAAIHVDSCSTLNGCPDAQKVSSLSGYASVPANGSFVQYSGGIYAVVGGALIHVDSCAILKCSGTVVLDPGGATDYAKAHPTPATGTLVKSVGPGPPASGWVGEVLGTAVIHVDSCTGLSGASCAGDVSLDSGGLADYMAAHPLPVDGTFIRSGSGSEEGYVDEVIGGALLHVGSCAPLNGCPGDETLDGGGFADYVSAHPLPANGTFVRVADGAQTGLLARVAGGAFLTIGDCDTLGGCTAPRSLDSNGFNAWSAAHTVPVDGTYLLGLPSNTTWEVLGGQRQQVPASPAAVPVDDTSLNAIPIATPPATTTAPTSGPPTTPTQTVTPPKSTTRTRRVDIQFKFKFRAVRRSSQLIWIRAPKLRRPLGITVSCRGRDCHLRTRTWRRGSAASFLRRFNGDIYHSGDRLIITVSRAGEKPEQITLTMRYNRLPLARLLGATTKPRK